MDKFIELPNENVSFFFRADRIVAVVEFKHPDRSIIYLEGGLSEGDQFVVDLPVEETMQRIRDALS